MSALAEKDSNEELKGTALEIYRFMVKAGRPLGIRELQRSLHLSSPSVAQYHLSRLEHIKLVKKEYGNYVIDHIILRDCVKIRHSLIPKYLFYSFFAGFILWMELTFLLQDPARNYIFCTVASAIFLLIFSYETTKVWLKRSL